MERRRIEVRGTVQGVGFRPFVFRTATELGLAGFVRNTGSGVLIEAEGSSCSLGIFLQRLEGEYPPHARIAELRSQPMPAATAEGFVIQESAALDERSVLMPPDLAPCEACLREMADPADRRYRYPFINCTDCGPRYTIVRTLPYDRPGTTMQAFAMCPACAAEYRDPADRRFHAQPIACPECGPRVWLTGSDGAEIVTSNPISAAARALTQGRIVAIKGVGGFHLAASALDPDAVARLRQRKERPAKPFAVMVADLEMARELCCLDAASEEALASTARPIVLVRRRADARIADGVAPGNRDLGLMLPSSPLHLLLLEETGIPLVMTSGNLTDEPIAFANADAITRLGCIADLMLLHDREIHIAADDAIVRVRGTTPALIRRGRGRTLEAIELPFEVAPILAMGGDLKGSIVLAAGRSAFASQHLGELGSPEAQQALRRTVEHLIGLTGITPAIIAHDLHPDYASTRMAAELAYEGVPRVAVQHHHAHIAACMAEHGLADEPVIGIALDGTGLGLDGTIWGGEVLIASYSGFERAAHLRPLPQPGNDAASREPWRMALAYLADAGVIDPDEPASWQDWPFVREAGEGRAQPVLKMIAQRLQSPLTSSCGRLFDAIAAMSGLCSINRFEGEAAIQLEQAADGADADPYPFAIAGSEIDLRPMIRTMADDVRRATPASIVSARFHETLGRAFTATCVAIRSQQPGLARVCLSGGCLQNELLATRLRVSLASQGFDVLEHALVPANDGGIALGQAVIAGSPCA